jgi:pimeloyl-ACP methyl ester carboxylesterase
MPTTQLTVKGVTSAINYVVQPSATGPVILLLHGHSSSVEEFDNLLPCLAGVATVYAFDMPNCGLSDDLDRDAVITAYADPNYGGLHYLRDLATEFATTVIASDLGSARAVRVAGGSLGGNLGLLLAEQVQPWVEQVFVWSPGSAWAPGYSQAVGGAVLRASAAIDWSQPAALDVFLQMTYRDKTLPPPLSSEPQPWYWYWDCWGQPQGPGQCQRTGGGGCPLCATSRPNLVCANGMPLANGNYPEMGPKKARAIEEALLRVSGRLTAARATWHWEIAAEQVEMSHLDKDASGNTRLAYLQSDTTFMAGERDVFPPAPLCTMTKALYAHAVAMFGTNGSPRIASHWFPDTGHSVHNERPSDLAAVLVA